MTLMGALTGCMQASWHEWEHAWKSAHSDQELEDLGLPCDVVAAGHAGLCADLLLCHAALVEFHLAY